MKGFTGTSFPKSDRPLRSTPRTNRAAGAPGCRGPKTTVHGSLLEALRQLGRSITRSFAAALAILLFTTSAWAQATAELSGTVRDESGAVLPGVTVVATQIDTGFSRTAVTDGGGVYAMPNLPTGPYRLEVSLQGFRTYVQTGIVLQVAAAPTINAVLAVGNLEETVAVEAAAPLVDVRSAGISEVVEQERILELPLQGRNVTDLIVLAGAAVSMGNAGPKSIPGSIGIGVAGGLPIGVAYTLDGAMHNNPYDNYNMPLPFPDALQEFSVATSGLSAQSGTHAGGSVNAVTKSGTNTLHGNLFEFVRDKKFNATAAFSPVGPDGKKLDDGLIRHQPGGTIGGPIVQDRLFFFGGYQGTFVRVNPPTAQSRVPTAAMLAGDFAAATSPACNAGRQIALRAPFVNNQINPALFSPAAINVAKQLPSSTDPCGEIRFSAPEEYDQGQIVGKVDYQAGANHSIFGRYMITFSDKQPGWPGSGNVLTTRPADTAQKHRAHSLTVGDTRVFGANTVNSVRVAWNRSQAGYHLEPYFGPEQIGVRNYHNYVPGVMSITVTGGFMTANGGSVLGQFDTDAYQVGDNLTLVRGAHQITLGSDVAYWQSDSLDGQRGGGVWQFNGSATGLGLADFLTGSVFSMGQARPGVLPMSQWHVGTYAQDSWRTSDRITINVGLRWEPFLGQNVRNNAIYNFNRDNYQQRIRSTVFPNAPLGLVYPGDSGSPGQAALEKQWTNLAPRAGIAWDVTGDGRTAVRSSYALAYDFMQAAYLWYSATSAPFSNRIEIRSPAGGFDDPYRGWPGRLPHPMPDVVTAADAYFPDFGAYGAVDPDINSTRVQSWNVIVERQIGTAWQVSASYLGSYTDRLWGQVQLNPGVFRGLGPCTIAGVVYPSCTVAGNLEQRRALFLDNPVTSQLGPIDLHDDVGKQDYRALKLSVQRRAASGLRLGGNYTLSRCMGNTVTSTFQQIGAGYLKPDDPAFDIGHCLQDRTHIGNITIGAETPQFQSAAMRVLASDWRVSGILNARSGSWLTVTTGRDIAGTGIQNQRPSEVKDSPYGDQTLLNYLTPTAFAYPDAGMLGDHKRGSIEGPGFWTIDLALSRIVGFASQQNVELRFEVFNLLNNFNWGDPVTNLDAGNFGQIISQTGDPRIMQFGIKYGF